MPPVKKIVLWLIVVFVLYAILTSPEEAASIFGSAWDVVVTGVQNIFAFFDRLLSGG
jgi:cell shape-determining protein MreC